MTQQHGMSVDVKVGQAIDIDNGRIRIVVEHKEGKRARLRIVADKSIIVTRPQDIATNKIA